MRVTQPLKDPARDEFYPATQHYTINEQTADPNDKESGGGWFPVGKNRIWHGGVHLDGDYPIHAITDGTIIAYRITDSYPTYEDEFEVTVKGQKKKLKLYDFPLSNNFVLIKHQLEPVTGYQLVFYSLYMHLLPFNKKELKDKKEYPPIFYSYNCVANSVEDGAGLLLHSEVDGSNIMVVPYGAYVTKITDQYKKDKGWKGWFATTNLKPGYDFQPVTYQGTTGFMNFDGNRLIPIKGSTHRVNTKENQPTISERGLAVKDSMGTHVVGLMKKGEEIDFVNKSEVVDENGTIFPGTHQCKYGGETCSIAVTSTNVKADKKSIDPILNSIETCEFPSRVVI